MKTVLYLSALLLCGTIAGAQNSNIDLQQMLKENKLMAYRKAPISITDGSRQGISGTGVIWLKGKDFREGTIEIDLRGKDIIQQSFLGIAFHGSDTTNYDVVYFRPFNFRATDAERKIHAVQYMSMPENSWARLREEHNGQYEKGVNPPPAGGEWFHVRIVVKGTSINVYVNNQSDPSLTVQKLNSRTSGMIGLWNEGLDGEFANLSIK